MGNSPLPSLHMLHNLYLPMYASLSSYILANVVADFSLVVLITDASIIRRR
jgi:hypothetical protein